MSISCEVNKREKSEIDVKLNDHSTSSVSLSLTYCFSLASRSMRFRTSERWSRFVRKVKLWLEISSSSLTQMSLYLKRWCFDCHFTVELRLRIAVVSLQSNISHRAMEQLELYRRHGNWDHFLSPLIEWQMQTFHLARQSMKKKFPIEFWW